MTGTILKKSFGENLLSSKMRKCCIAEERIFEQLYSN